MTNQVGNLSVNLSLTSAEFKKGIQDVNRQLKIAQSEFKLTGAGVDGFGKSLDGMKAKSRMLEQSLQLQQSKVEQLRQRYEQLKATNGENDAATQRMLVSYNNAQAQMRRMESDLNRVNDQIRLQSNTWHQLGERLQSVGQRMQSVGRSMQNVGRDLSMKVTAPIVGLGTLALKAGTDFEEGMDKVASVSGAVGEDFNKLRDMAKKLGAETKYSATEASDGMQYLALAGFKTNEILSAMPGLLDLAAAGALDLGKAADITSDVMSAFGLSADTATHAADVFAFAQANANTNVEQLGEAMKYAAPSANSFGWTLEETSAAMMVLANSGLKGSIAGQAFASSLTRLAKPTEKMSKLMKLTGTEFFDAQGNMKSMPDLLKAIEASTAGMTQESRAAYLSTLFGMEAYKHWAILLESGSDTLREMTGELINADGAAKKMADTMNDNAKGDIKTLLSALEGLAIQLSEILIPILRDMTQKLTEWTRKFASLSPEAQKMILVFAGIAAAIPPIIMAFGALASGIGAIITAFGTVSGAIAVVSTGVAATTPAVGALATAFTVLTGPIGIAVAGIAALTVGGIALVKHLKKDAIPEVDRFGKGVSKSTKEALGGFFELSDGASLKLRELSLTQQKVTEETKNELVAAYGEMNEQILAKMDERHVKQMEKTKNFFQLSNALTQEEEAEILRKQEMRNQSEIAGQEYKEQRIKEIYQKAYAEKRGITESEEKEIASLHQQMNEKAVEYLSKNELESKIIMEKMKQTAGDLSARQAAEVVANSNKQKEEAVKAAEKQYEGTIAEIIRLRDETGDMTAEQADRAIKEATRQRDVTVMRAEETHKKVVDEAKKQANEHINHVNWETGEVLSKWESFKKKMGVTFDLVVGLTKKYWKMASDEVTKKANEMKENAIEKFNELKNKAEEKFNETKEKIMTPIKEAKEKVLGWINEIKGFFSNLKLKLPQIEMPKLPQFKLTGEFGLKPPSVPKISVDWYAKGAVFTKPTIFNTPFGMKGFGEAGAEAALPLTNKVLGTIGEMIAKTMPQSGNQQPINVELNYTGNNVQDAYEMMDIIEHEMEKRFILNKSVMGVS